MKTKVGLLIAAGLALIAGCGRAGYESARANPEAGYGGAPAPGMESEGIAHDNAVRTESKGADVPQATAAVYSQRQIIRTASLEVRVKKVDEAEKEALRLTREAGGFVESSSSSGLAGSYPRMDLAIRVPVGRFDDVLQAFSNLGVPMSKTITGEDVTAQLVDLEARLKTLSAQEETLREMLKSTRTVKDMLEVQGRLTDIRTQIEQIAAQRKNMAELAALSTIRLSLIQSSETALVAAKDQSWATEAWGQASSALMGALRKIGTAAIWLIVYSPIWLVALVLLKLAWKGLRRRTEDIAA